jgi:hypothetical protein
MERVADRAPIASWLAREIQELEVPESSRKNDNVARSYGASVDKWARHCEIRPNPANPGDTAAQIFAQALVPSGTRLAVRSNGYVDPVERPSPHVSRSRQCVDCARDECSGYFTNFDSQ